jgi:uncharacterized membrane protein YphA (DoxX/SURF4 family)
VLGGEVLKEQNIKNQILKVISSPYLTTIMRMMVGIIFIYASLDKLANPAYFAGTIQNYQILPDSLINLAAIILPWLELICGISLITGLWHQSAAIIISTLTIIFILAIGSVIFRGFDIECGCFGSGSAANWGRIVEDIFLLAFSLQIVFNPASKLSLENFRNQSD